MALINECTLEFDVKSQADELFKLFTRSLKDKEAKVEIEAEDSEKREITVNVTTSDILRKYKTYKVTATFTDPKDDGDGSLVKWTSKIEKIPDGDIHDHIGSNITVEVWRKSPADELFKAFMEAFKDDDEAEIEAEDCENREIKIKLICSTGIWKNYKTLKVTIVITPTDGDGSHVNCTGVFEQIPEDVDDPFLSIKTAACLFKIIDDSDNKVLLFHVSST